MASVALFFLGQNARAVIRDGGIDTRNLGKGEWIYILSTAENQLGGNVPSVTGRTSLMRYLKNQGMQYIVVKSAEGAGLFPSAGSPQFTASVVNEAHAAGLKIFGYCRNRGDDIPGEIAMVDYVFNLGADGFVFDAESEWKQAGYATLALQLCSASRSNWPTKFFAHSPFAYIHFHSSFPYKEFGYYCDAVMPQLYWVEFGETPTVAVNTMNSDWINFHNGLNFSTTIDGFVYRWTNSIKPIVTAGQGWSGQGPITGPQIAEFANRLKTISPPASPGGYKGANYFRAELHPAEIWDEVQTNFFGNVYTNAPVIEFTPVVTVGSTNASIVWPTDQSSDSVVEYGLTTSYGNATTNSTFLWFHTVNVTGLSPNTTYQFRVNSKNSSNQVGVSSNYVFTTVPATFSDVIVESRLANGTVTANPPYLDSGFGNSTLKSSASPLSGLTNQGSRYSESGTPGVSPTFTVTPTLPVAGAVYDVYLSHGIATSISDDIVVAVTKSGCTGLPSTTTIFREPGGNTWELLGRMTNNAGVVSPSLTFTHSSGVTAGARMYSDAVKFVYVPPSPSKPTISTQPQPQTVNQNSTATFTVVASGTAPLLYQWKRNGTNVASATDSSFIKNNVQPADAGNYSVAITNSVGSTNSASVALTVNQLPSITNPPQNVSASVGTNVTFSVTATGTAPLSYQWKFDDVNIPGANETNYTRSNIQSVDQGVYSVVVTNVAGEATASANLTVIAPSIQINSINLLPNGTVRLQITGAPGNYFIDGTTNLGSWTEITNTANTNGTFEFIDPVTNLLRRFYRARSAE